MHFGPFGLIKVLVVFISFALAICFVGCGDDSSSGATNGDNSKVELNSEAEADSADVSGDADDADVSSSSEDDEDDEEISSDSDDEDEEEEEAEEAESSSSSKAKAKSSSSKAKPSDDEVTEDPDDPEDPGVEPAKPESSPSDESLYPDLSVLNDTTLKQGCDIDKNDDVWVIPSLGLAAEKTVYIWRGDEVSISSVVETDLKLPSLCEMALGTVDSTLAGEEDLKRTCDGGVMRVYSSTPFQKGDRDAVYENATVLCRDDLF
jgi:DNA mismatch repair ATPase MutL